MQAHESTPRASRRARAAPITNNATPGPSREARNAKETLFPSAAPRAFPYSPLPPSSPRSRASPAHSPTRLPTKPIPSAHAHDAAEKVPASDDLFGFFAAERKLAHVKPPSPARARKLLSPEPQPVPTLVKPLIDTAYDSDDALYASRSGSPALDLFPAPRHNRAVEPDQASSDMPPKKPGKRTRATTPASSVLSSLPGTPQKQKPPRGKRARTAGKENPPDENGTPDRSSEPPRSPLAAKKTLRRSTRATTVKARARKQPARSPVKNAKGAAKTRRNRAGSEDSVSESDAETSEGEVSGTEHRRAGPYSGTAMYKAERKARIAYFKDVDDYQFETENVYVV